MAIYELGYTVTDVLTLEANAAKGLSSATMEDGTAVTFASLLAMRTQIKYMRQQLGLVNTTATGFASIVPTNDTDDY